jgi:mycothiol system anti-sigma-R factor
MSQNSCLDALLKLYPYLDGELSEADAAEVRRHFELCHPCTPALHYLRSFRDSLHRASDDQLKAPDLLRSRLNELLRAAQ